MTHEPRNPGATTHEVVIIGSGPAGYTAAVYTARANLAPVVIEGAQFGGALMQTTDVENFPGFPDGIMGPDLMIQMREQVARFGTRFVEDIATRVDFSQRPFKVWVGDDLYLSRVVIVATGASAKWLGLDEEKPVSLGVFPTDRPTTLHLSPAIVARLSNRALLAVSVEPPGGSPTGQPTGPVIAKGAIAGA